MKNLIDPILSSPGRNLQIIRYVTSIVAMILIICTLVGPSMSSNKFYFSKISCGHLDLSNGIYNSLRNAVSASSVDQGNSDYPVDLSLTNSEITIFSEYAQAQVANTPQYIVESLWQWCSGDYDVVTTKTKLGGTRTKDENFEVTCHRNKTNAFDYRSQLEFVGLEVIVAYAYQGVESNGDSTYERSTTRRRKLYKLVPSALIFAACSQFVTVIFALILYGNKGVQHELNQLKAFLVHFLAVFSVASFCSVVIAVAIMTYLVHDVQKEIQQQMVDFGISVSYGSIWFLLIWCGFAMSFLAMLSWAFPLWCANPVLKDDNDEDSMVLGRQMTQRSIRRSKKGTMSSRTVATATSTSRRDGEVRGPLLDDMEGTIPFNTESHDLTSDENVEYNERQLNRLPGEEEFGDDDDDLYHTDPTAIRNSVTGEHELRKLGESISRKSSVRHLNRKISSKNNSLSRTKRLPTPLESDVLFDDVYPTVGRSDSAPSQHYREETYDGYNNILNVGRTGSGGGGSNPKAVTQKKLYGKDLFNSEGGYQNNSNPFAAQSDLLNAFQRNKRESTGEESFLNDDEMEFLDFNNYINRVN